MLHVALALPLVEFEIDADLVELAAQACWQRVDLGDLLCRVEDGLIHDRIARRGGDFPMQDGPISGNPDLELCHEVLRGAHDTHRLLPRAVKAVADDPVIPSKVGNASFTASLPDFIRPLAIARSAAVSTIGFIRALHPFCLGFRGGGSGLCLGC